MNESKLSPALELLQLTWEGVHSNDAMWSWARLNRCMQDALHLSIEAGLGFGLDDFAYISKNFRWGWWAGDGEGFYAHAVIENNMSAIKALEYHFNRKPFIVNGIVQYWHGHFTPRSRGRLAIGSTFLWQGKRLTVTSFVGRSERVVACSYKPLEYDERGYLSGSLKVEHIYKLTHKELKEAKT